MSAIDKKKLKQKNAEMMRNKKQNSFEFWSEEQCQKKFTPIHRQFPSNWMSNVIKSIVLTKSFIDQ